MDKCVRYRQSDGTMSGGMLVDAPTDEAAIKQAESTMRLLGVRLGARAVFYVGDCKRSCPGCDESNQEVQN